MYMYKECRWNNINPTSVQNLFHSLCCAHRDYVESELMVGFGVYAYCVSLSENYDKLSLPIVFEELHHPHKHISAHGIWGNDGSVMKWSRRVWGSYTYVLYCVWAKLCGFYVCVCVCECVYRSKNIQQKAVFWK